MSHIAPQALSAECSSRLAARMIGSCAHHVSYTMSMHTFDGPRQRHPRQGMHHGRSLSPEPLAPPPQCASANPPPCGARTATHLSLDGARSTNRHMVLDAGNIGGGRYESLARLPLLRSVLSAQCPSRGPGDLQPRPPIRDRGHGRTRTRERHHYKTIARTQLIFISWWLWRCGENQGRREERRWPSCEAGPQHHRVAGLTGARTTLVTAHPQSRMWGCSAAVL
jgi:hypothetical protein